MWIAVKCLYFHFPHCTFLYTDDQTERNFGGLTPSSITHTHTHRVLTNIRGRTYLGTCNGSPFLSPVLPPFWPYSHHYMKARIYFQVRVRLFILWLQFVFILHHSKYTWFDIFCLLFSSNFCTSTACVQHGSVFCINECECKSCLHSHSSSIQVPNWGPEVLIVFSRLFSIKHLLCKVE
jgi:hypothetical protein